MKYQEFMLVIVMLFAGNIVASRVSLAQAETEQHHHHHDMAMAGDNEGYQRSVESYAVPDVKLVDMNGAESSLLDDLSGRTPIMLNFIFTSCTAICPVMSATFRNVQDSLGKEIEKVRMVSISIDPENDTPARLKEYAEKYHAGPQWQMLTGRIQDSIAVQRAFGVYRGDKMSHTPVTFLRPRGANSQWVRLDGLVSAGDIIKEYRALAP